MKSPAELRSDAARCRRLAAGVADMRTSESLLELALSYEAEAEALEGEPRQAEAERQA